MSIGHFPTPHPEELFYSVCARFQDRVEYGNKKFVSRELFGSWCAPVVDLPARLGYFTGALPHGHGLTIDRIVEGYTLFPIYRPFLPSRRAQRVRGFMERDAVQHVKMGAGSSGTRVRQPDYLRFCPACVGEDVRLFREPYWHRVHQFPGVVVCPTHHVFLEDSSARVRLPANQFDYVSAERAIYAAAPPRPVDRSDATHQALLNIARDAAWLLGQRGLSSGFAALRLRYVHAFFELGYCTYSGFVDKAKLTKGLRDHYGPDFLRLLRCELREDTDSNWASVFIKDLSKRKVHHPLQHLLIIQFLGFTAQSFFNMLAEYKPFGEGPWPCLNPVCDDYKKSARTTHKLTFSYSKRKRRPVGIFGCACGFAYSRTGPDSSEEDKLRYDRVSRHGQKWDDTLRDLWDNSTLFLEEISLRLYGKRRLDYKIKIQAERLGLRFPRQIKTYRAAREFRRVRTFGPPAITIAKRKPAEPTSDTVEEHRAQWLEALQQNPHASRTMIRNKFSRVYKWLSKYDGKWLKEHLLPPKDHSFDWAGLDAKLAKEVREGAHYIQLYSVPMRVTVYALGRYTDMYDYLRHNLDRLPQTAAVLREVLETTTDFQQRLRRPPTGFLQSNLAAPQRAGMTDRV